MQQRGNQYGVRHLIAQESSDLHQYLHETLQLNKDSVDSLIHLGSIYKNHLRLSLADSHLPLQSGDYLRVHSTPRRFPVGDIQWQKHILYSDDHFLVLDKPSGIPTHASVDNMQENLLTCLEGFFTQKLFVTHRLDVPTSGLIVIAKTKSFQREFNQLLTQGQVSKYYIAQVQGIYCGPLILEHYMEPSPRAPKRLVADPTPGFLHCRLEILDVKTESNTSTLLIQLHTGRTHQIRAQLAATGYPIIGDSLYGAAGLEEELETIRLSCTRLAFARGDQTYDFRR